MNWEMIGGLVRHILTFGGGFVVAKGWLDEATVEQVIGALVTLGGVAWSAYSKKAAAKPEA